MLGIKWCALTLYVILFFVIIMLSIVTCVVLLLLFFIVRRKFLFLHSIVLYLYRFQLITRAYSICSNSDFVLILKYPVKCYDPCSRKVFCLNAMTFINYSQSRKALLTCSILKRKFYEINRLARRRDMALILPGVRSVIMRFFPQPYC